MEGRNLKACVTELPALQPSPSTSDSSLTLQLHKGTLQQSYSENSILNTRKQRHTHAKEETKQKKKAHALSRLWLCKITYSESNGTGYVFIMYPKFLHLPHPRTTACPQRLSLHILSSETTEKRPQQKKKNLPRGITSDDQRVLPPTPGSARGCPPSPLHTKRPALVPPETTPPAGRALPSHTHGPPPALTHSLPPVPGSSHGAPHTHSRPPHRQPPSHTPGPRPGASLSHKPTVKPHSCRPHPGPLTRRPPPTLGRRRPWRPGRRPEGRAGEGRAGQDRRDPGAARRSSPSESSSSSSASCSRTSRGSEETPAAAGSAMAGGRK